MRIRLTDPELVDKVIDRIANIDSLPVINREIVETHLAGVCKEELEKGHTVTLEVEWLYDHRIRSVGKALRYWALEDTTTDKEFINTNSEDHDS